MRRKAGKHSDLPQIPQATHKRKRGRRSSDELSLQDDLIEDGIQTTEYNLQVFHPLPAATLD